MVASVDVAAGALKAYDKALQLFRKAATSAPTKTTVGLANGSTAPPTAEADLPVKLLNNASVLHMRLGNLSAATPLMQEAVRVVPSPAWYILAALSVLPVQDASELQLTGLLDRHLV